MGVKAMSKILSLRAENVKKLKAIHIEPDGSPVVVIAGKNGQGKSSALDSIAYAFAGKSAQCARPVREGEDKATIVCETDDLVVRRVINANGGGTLVVSNREGLKYSSPQKVLDALVGELTFDPLEFSRMEADKQLATLKQLAGLDFAKQDNQRASLYAQRTETNREIKRLKALLLDAGDFSDTPSEPANVDELAAEIDRINRSNNERERTKREHTIAKSRVETLTKDLEQARQDLKELGGKLEPIEDPAPLVKRMKDAHEISMRIRLKEENMEKKKELETLQAAAEGFTAEIQLFDELKQKKIKGARFPVEGLGLNDDGVTYQGIPFEQASTSERIRVSVAMGLAMNPKLSVLLIRNGNDLDADNLELVWKMAAEADAQVWLERIDATGDVAVVIEDGLAVGP